MPAVMPMETLRECINSTHLQTIMPYTQCDGSCTEKNITQLINCTSGCDQPNNICKYSMKSDSSYASIIGMGIVAVIFLVLSMQFSKQHPAMQTLFMLVGLYLLILLLGLTNSIAQSSGAGLGTIKSIETGLTIITWVIYVFMVYFFMLFLYNVLMGMLPKNRFRHPL
jgi:hypothetical protein